jgi:ubiquinone/menaquinone biosynthesis C-methylase UbiE
MDSEFQNVYEDPVRADAYASMEFPGSYYLAFRDLPELILCRVHGNAALDFGCGAGRSTRFLRDLGFHVAGVDISEAMLKIARQRDPSGDYLHVVNGDLTGLKSQSYDLILSAFAFDNIPDRDLRIHLLSEMRRLLSPSGIFVNLVSAPDIYFHEWVSFSTQDFPENQAAVNGDRVRIVMLDVEDRRPVVDVFCTDEEYRSLYHAAGLALEIRHQPLGRISDPVTWKTECDVSPWSIYVLRPEVTATRRAEP